MAASHEGHGRLWSAIVVALAASGAICGSAAAQSFFDRYMAPETAAAPCYVRSADSDAPPEQRSRLQTFIIEPKPNPRAKPPRTFSVGLEFTVAGVGEAYVGAADCETVGQLARCDVADRGGRFTLSPQGDGLRLTLGNRLELKGAEGFSPDLADGQDDLIFALRPGEPESCSVKPVAIRSEAPAAVAQEAAR